MKRDYVNVFQALSDPSRIRIIKMLFERELCMCEIREILHLSNSTVSQHLTILRNAGLLADDKEGRWVNFRLNRRSESPFIRSVLKLVKESFDDDAVIRADTRTVHQVDRNRICGIRTRTTKSSE